MNHPATSDDLRTCILRWRLDEGHSLEECAERAGITVRTVQNILATKRNHNSLRNPRRLPAGRRRILEHDDNAYISSILAAQPTLFIDEIRDRLEAARGTSVSLSTLSRTITRVGLSHKKISQEALERNDLLRASWQVRMGKYTSDQLVFIDESAVDDHTNQRAYGYSMLGRACVQRATFLRGQRYSVLPALDVDGIVTMDLFEGSVNKDRFIRWLREDLVRAGCHRLIFRVVYLHIGTSSQSSTPFPKCRCHGQLFYPP